LFSLLSLPYLVYGRRFALYRVFQGYIAQLIFAKGNLNPEPGTRNPKPETRNPEPETPNVKQQFKYNVYVLL
jgi:hypothetical protein